MCASLVDRNSVSVVFASQFIQVHSSSNTGVVWGSLTELSYGGSSDRERSGSEQKWPERVEILSSAPLPTLLGIIFDLGITLVTL